MSLAFDRILQELFATSPSPLEQPSAVALASYLELLLRWSRRVNLTGFRDPLAAAEGLLYDGAELAPLLPRDAVLLDIGSGAGGLAFCLAHLRDDIFFHLVEPRTKRAVFLRTATRELKLSDRVEVIEARAESLPQERAASIDVAMAQAVFPPEQWLPLGSTLVRPGGTVVCLTAKPLDRCAGPSANLEIVLQRDYRLPRSGAARVITLLEKG